MLNRVAVSVAAALLTAAPALAQRADELDPLKDNERWLAVVAALVLVAAVGVASFLSSRRGHQD